MRILITGGSGLIGRAAAADLAAAGHEVIVLSRDPERARRRLAEARLPAPQPLTTPLSPPLTTPLSPPLPAPANAGPVRAERWDGRSAAGWGALLDREAAILNLAGENLAAGRWTARRKEAIRASRVDAGRAVVAAVRQAEVRPQVLLQSSATGYYGNCGDLELSEDHPAGSDFLAEVALAWEESSVEVEALGVRRVVLRTGLVLAPDGGALAKMAPAFRFGLGGPMGSGRQWWSWIHLADEVLAIRFLLERSAARGPFNLTAPEPVRNRDFARALGRALHRPALLPAPAPLLRLALGEMAEAVLHDQRVLPARLLAAGFAFAYPRLAGALASILP